MNFLNAFDDKKPLGLLRAAILIVPCASGAQHHYQLSRGRGRGDHSPAARGAGVLRRVPRSHPPPPPSVGGVGKTGRRSLVTLYITIDSPFRGARKNGAAGLSKSAHEILLNPPQIIK